MIQVKKLLVITLLFISISSFAQFGFGIEGGFQQSIPLVMRDSFSGKPSPGAALHFYFPSIKKTNLTASLSYQKVSLNHKINASGLSWQTLGIGIGNNWVNSKKRSSEFYTGVNTYYIFDYGKTSLSGGSKSGLGYSSIKSSQKIVPAIELGITFKPKPLLNLKFSIIQPITQTKIDGRPSLPGTLKFGLEYHLTTRDFKKFKMDTAITEEQKFTNNLKNGKLYFIESGTDSSIQLFKKMITAHYAFSKVDYFSLSSINKKLIEFENSPDSNFIFIVKSGNIIYSTNKQSTLGLIVYNYKMENPLTDEAFFVRNLSSDNLLEDPLIVKKLIKTLNGRLFRMYNSNKK